jgi:hypothetical protein
LHTSGNQFFLAVASFQVDVGMFDIKYTSIADIIDQNIQ